MLFSFFINKQGFITHVFSLHYYKCLKSQKQALKMLACKDVQNNSNSYTVPYFSIRHMKYLSKSKDDQQLARA